jgi:hypothetical protein
MMQRDMRDGEMREKEKKKKRKRKEKKKKERAFVCIYICSS